MTITSIGGYRLVRRIGAGARADLFLGHPEAESRAGRPVAVKVFRFGVERSSIDAELAALEAAQHEHCVRLLDLATAANGSPVLILERLPLGTLTRLLAERETLRPGEVVTILAPIALAIDRLHSAGVTHGAIASEHIGFREDGAPVLLGFGSARLTAGRVTPASRSADARVAHDVSAFATVAQSVISRAGPGNHQRVGAWIEQAALDGGAGIELVDLADRLFECAEPTAVSFATSTPAPSTGLPGRLVIGEPVPETVPEPARSGVVASLHLPPWADEFLGSFPLASVRKRVVNALGTVRKPVWFAAGAVAIALIVAIAVVPQDSAGSEAEAPSPVAQESFEPIDASAVTSDDPLAALLELLAARERCFADLSVLCLDSVDQLGSPALAADRAAIEAVQDGAELPGSALPESALLGGEASLVERLGGSALISLALADNAEPASVLLMKGEAGWRIRAWLD